MYTEEPAQIGPRRVVVNRPGELGTVVIAHKVPNGRDADQPALEMLDGILSSGKSSRLYHALVDRRPRAERRIRYGSAPRPVSAYAVCDARAGRHA